MRIAQVTATFPPYYSGTGLVCAYNAVGLAQRGHAVTVFTAETDLPGGYQDPPGIRVRRLPAPLRFGNAPLLPGLISEIKDFDLIHLHHPFIFGAELTWAVSKTRSIPYILTHHNDLIGDGIRRFLFGAYVKVSTRAIFVGARRIMVVTQDHARNSRLSRLLRQRWNEVVEIPNGVDTNLFRPGIDGRTIRAQVGIPEDAPVILFVGTIDRAHHYRRIDILLQALARLNNSTIHLLLAGDGDQKHHYQNLAGDYGLEPLVHFLGSINHSNLPSVYAAADVIALPSQIQESFGMVLIEAMACGKPVVTSRLPGVRTVVSDGEDGLLTQAGDAADLADKLATLLYDSERRELMGKRGRSKVEALYAWPIVIEGLEQIYAQVLSETGRRQGSTSRPFTRSI